jgi:hypothetical protein
MANAPVPSAVLSATQNLRTRQAMLLGSDLEGGWGPDFAVGDNGTSFGPYQMHEGGLLTSLGLSPAQAENANTATQAMLPYYENAVNQISDQQWQNDPQHAAEQSAFIAESPAEDYYASGRPVSQDWSQVTAVLQNQKSTGGMPTDATLTAAGNAGGIPSVSNLWSLFQDLLGLALPGSGLGSGAGSIGTSIKSDLERVGLVIFGGILIIVGIVVLVMPAERKVASAALQTSRAGKATGLITSGHSGPSPAEVQRKNAIAQRSLDIGQQKVDLQRQRENRLAARSS